MIKRKNTYQMKISEIQSNPSKEVWDVDYMSTSDEEDNDSEPEDEESLK